MKLLFSEYKSDYDNYIFPYAVWGIPDADESPALLFAKGFLPGSRNLDRFYLCRQVRVKLENFSLSSENRRIIRKCENIHYQLIPRGKFDYNQERREFCKNYADIKFGKDVMTYERLDSLFNSKIVTHVLLFLDSETNREAGLVTLYVAEKELAYYYYAFYDLNYYQRNLGMFMMTSAVDYFSRKNYNYIYLGTCYSRNALYKTQFTGAEFFNGFCWSNDLKELKYLIERDQHDVVSHLIETEEFREQFYDGSLEKILKAGHFVVKPR